FGVNLITMHPQLDPLIDLCLAEGISHVVLAGGLPPAAAIRRLKEGGARVIGFASALGLAKRLIRNGFDALVIEGAEAGGHIGPVSTSGGNMAAQTATGATVAGASLDRITGFENATGGAAGDRLHGSGVANVLKGNGGTDMLFGYGGDDTLSGGASFDNLVGGAGRDVLTGGSEADSFDFAARTDSGVTAATRDVITDFEDFVDVINLAPMDADSTRAGNDAFRFIGMHTAFTGHAGELRAVFSGAGEVVEADTNGDGIADFSVALRDSAHSIVLSAADFIL
ncbi:MAG: nitronate monooxygenase, partial [Amaricoccus sp.]|uniref:nitronate monooxygenase n=1 Tax=Amaricoccus sp. TaxID=1872485 RepID=UPI0033149E75